MVPTSNNTICIEQLAWALHLTRPNKMTYDTTTVNIWFQQLLNCLTRAIQLHRSKNDMSSLKAIRLIVNCTFKTCNECNTTCHTTHWYPFVSTITTDLLEWIINVGQHRIASVDCTTYHTQLRRTIECVCSSLFYCTWFKSMRNVKRKWLLDTRYNVDELHTHTVESFQHSHLLVLGQLLRRIKDQEFGAKERIEIGLTLTRLRSSGDLSSLSYNRCNSERHEFTLKRLSSEPQLNHPINILKSNDLKNSHAVGNSDSSWDWQLIPPLKKRKPERIQHTHSTP